MEHKEERAKQCKAYNTSFVLSEMVLGDVTTSSVEETPCPKKVGAGLPMAGDSHADA
jgi:hypothetical protein